MGERQQRYRDRRLAEGWERLELLVPAAAVPWLKAYAHAARAADTLGLPPPRFEGMGATVIMPSTTNVNTKPSPVVKAETQSHAEGALVTPSPAKSSDAADALFQRIEERQEREGEAANCRPDFSGGLIRKDDRAKPER